MARTADIEISLVMNGAGYDGHAFPIAIHTAKLRIYAHGSQYHVNQALLPVYIKQEVCPLLYCRAPA
jgi:hypothetical protein